MSDEIEKNTNSGPEEPVNGPVTTEAILDSKTGNVISLADFKAGKRSDPEKEHWPAAIPQSQGEPVKVTASAKDPSERRLLISSTYGDVVMDGFLGLNPGFIAVGDAQGKIKFALASGVWLAACDVTDDPKYTSDDVA